MLMYQTVIDLEVVVHHKYHEVEVYYVLQLAVKAVMRGVMVEMVAPVEGHQDMIVNHQGIMAEPMAEMEQMELQTRTKAELVKEEQHDPGVVVRGLPILEEAVVEEQLATKDVMELAVTTEEVTAADGNILMLIPLYKQQLPVKLILEVAEEVVMVTIMVEVAPLLVEPVVPALYCSISIKERIQND